VPGTSADAALRLTRPRVPQTELTAIAAAFPELRPVVTRHPSRHPELRAWGAQATPPAPPAPAPIMGPPPAVALISVGVPVLARPDASGAGGAERGSATSEGAVDDVVS